MQDVYKTIEECNLEKKRKILIVFDGMIADMIDKKINLIVTEYIVRGRKLNILIIFITKSYFKIPKDVRLNTTIFLIVKIPNQRELQQMAINHSSDIYFKDFIKTYKKHAAEPNYFLLNNATLPLDNPLQFRIKMKLKIKNNLKKLKTST